MISAANFQNVITLDLTAAICESERCPVDTNGMVRYSDSNHMTASFAASLAPVLGVALDDVMNPTSRAAAARNP